eukprot:jgi/Mesvir1/22473/Mv20136-RA.1
MPAWRLSNVAARKLAFSLVSFAILWDAFVLGDRKLLLRSAGPGQLHEIDVEVHEVPERAFPDSTSRRDDDKDFTLNYDDVYCDLPRTSLWIASRKEPYSRTSGQININECRSAMFDYRETISRINSSYFEPIRANISNMNGLLRSAHLDSATRQGYLDAVGALKSRTLYLLLSWFEDFNTLVLCKRARMYCFGYEPFCSIPVTAHAMERSDVARSRRLELDGDSGSHGRDALEDKQRQHDSESADSDASDVSSSREDLGNMLSSSEDEDRIIVDLEDDSITADIDEDDVDETPELEMGMDTPAGATGDDDDDIDGSEEDEDEDDTDCFVPCPGASSDAACAQSSSSYWHAQRRQLDAIFRQYQASVTPALDDIDKATSIQHGLPGHVVASSQHEVLGRYGAAQQAIMGHARETIIAHGEVEALQGALSRAMASVMRGVYEGLILSLDDCQALSADDGGPCRGDGGTDSTRDMDAEGEGKAVLSVGSFF